MKMQSQGTTEGHGSLALCGSAAYFQLLKCSPPLLFLILLDFLPTPVLHFHLQVMCLGQT